MGGTAGFGPGKLAASKRILALAINLANPLLLMGRGYAGIRAGGLRGSFGLSLPGAEHGRSS
jgi:hypothetical protein